MAKWEGHSVRIHLLRHNQLGQEVAGYVKLFQQYPVLRLVVLGRIIFAPSGSTWMESVDNQRCLRGRLRGCRTLYATTEKARICMG